MVLQWLMKALWSHYSCNPSQTMPYIQMNGEEPMFNTLITNGTTIIATCSHLGEKKGCYFIQYFALKPATAACTLLHSCHPLPLHIIHLQIDKEIRDSAGTVIQYWNLTVWDQIWWSVILSALLWPHALQYLSGPWAIRKSLFSAPDEWISR